MNTDDFARELARKQSEMRNYVNLVFPRRAGEISMRFIDNNFRMQGYQGATFQAWPATKKGGTILVKTATLRRGNHFTTGTAITQVYNDIKYGAAHNNGFNGTVEIKAHQRRLLSAKKTATGRVKIDGKPQMQTIHGVSGIQQVRAHTRRMNIPQRKFFPTSWNDSSVLANDLLKEMSAGIKHIFEP